MNIWCWVGVELRFGIKANQILSIIWVIKLIHFPHALKISVEKNFFFPFSSVVWNTFFQPSKTRILTRFRLIWNLVDFLFVLYCLKQTNGCLLEIFPVILFSNLPVHLLCWAADCRLWYSIKTMHLKCPWTLIVIYLSKPEALIYNCKRINTWSRLPCERTSFLMLQHSRLISSFPLSFPHTNKVLTGSGAHHCARVKS